MQAWIDKHGEFWFYWWRGGIMNVVTRMVTEHSKNMTIQSSLSYQSFCFRHNEFVSSLDSFSIDKAQQVEGRLDAFV